MCQTSAQVGTQIGSQKILTGQQGLALEKKDSKEIFFEFEFEQLNVILFLLYVWLLRTSTLNVFRVNESADLNLINLEEK